ncbi:CLUMA_CG020813, isoform A [Clunio marinus]|uniref:CLUMA_CG020813, isoform A n=1 Tax=Clunio marinus TaxID=568069 RepID=A0A1J1J627_9DIPT|nr:CLUMA_CG020813, isoform A [Clunio marinus]
MARLSALRRKIIKYSLIRAYARRLSSGKVLLRSRLASSLFELCRHTTKQKKRIPNSCTSTLNSDFVRYRFKAFLIQLMPCHSDDLYAHSPTRQKSHTDRLRRDEKCLYKVKTHLIKRAQGRIIY